MEMPSPDGDWIPGVKVAEVHIDPHENEQTGEMALEKSMRRTGWVCVSLPDANTLRWVDADCTHAMLRYVSPTKKSLLCTGDSKSKTNPGDP